MGGLFTSARTAALRVGAGVLLIAGAFAAARSLNNAVIDNRLWIEKVNVPTVSKFDSDSFISLTRGGAVWAERQGAEVRIGHVSCDSLSDISPEQARLADGLAGAAGKPLVKELCRSAQGERIREEIANFNRSFLLGGISDNRKAHVGDVSATGVPCSDGNGNALLYVPSGCIANEWIVSVASDGRPAQAASAAAVSSEAYAFLADPRLGYFGAWKTVSPFIDPLTGKPSDQVFKSAVEFGDGAVHVRVIGAVKSVTIDGMAAVVPDGGKSREEINAGGKVYIVSVNTACRIDTVPKGQSQACDAKNAAGRPIGSRVQIIGPPGKKADIAIVATPSAVAPAALLNQSKSGQNGKSPIEQAPVSQESAKAENSDSLACQPVSLVGSVLAAQVGHLRMACQPDMRQALSPSRGPAGTGCQVCWVSSKRGEPVAESVPVKDVSASGLLVIDSSGSLTQKAFDLEYGQLLGLGTDDAGSVIQSLAYSGKSVELSLSIDPEIQKIAAAALEGSVSCNAFEDCGRRADLVVIDANGETAGELLAAASLPRPSRGISAWDLETLERSAPGKSPLAAHAWRNHDFRATPGSSFKIVTALAASQHVLDNPDPELEAILLGTDDPELLVRRFGLAKAADFDGLCDPDIKDRNYLEYNALPIKGKHGELAYCIGNARNGEDRPDIGGLFAKAKSEQCKKTGKPGEAGLCEALRDSSNLFFGGLAVALDGAKLVTPGADNEIEGDVPDLLIAKMARRLFAPVDKAAPASKDIRALLDVNYGYSPRAKASPIIVGATSAPPDGGSRRLLLAQGGIGLSVTASPLAMAVIAASVGTGTIVRPHAVPFALRGETQDPLEGLPILVAPQGREELSDRLLAEIRLGMNAVVLSGTASGTLGRGLDPELKSHVFVKTGTAPVLGKTANAPAGRNAGWLVGYVEPPGGKSGINRRLAFACRIALTDATGGAACGPVIKRLLNALHESRR